MAGVTNEHTLKTTQTYCLIDSGSEVCFGSLWVNSKVLAKLDLFMEVLRENLTPPPSSSQKPCAVTGLWPPPSLFKASSEGPSLGAHCTLTSLSRPRPLWPPLLPLASIIQDNLHILKAVDWQPWFHHSINFSLMYNWTCSQFPGSRAWTSCGGVALFCQNMPIKYLHPDSFS